MKKKDVSIVMDRKKIAGTIHTVCDAGMAMLKKKSFDSTDHVKLKVIRNMGSFVNSGVAMVQQETAQEKMVLIRDRMDQLGYNKEPKKIGK